MKKIISGAVLAAFFNIFSFAQDASLSYNGKTVNSINVSTKRINPSIIKKKFLISEGKTFDAQDYELAKQSLHNMGIFKEINFDIKENEDSAIDINIDAKDSFYVFPMLFGAGGSKSVFSAMLMEANVFKLGETAFAFGAFNSDGYSAIAALGFAETFLSLGFSEFEYEEKIYKNNSYNSSGLFSSSSDKNVKYADPVKKYDVNSAPPLTVPTRPWPPRTGPRGGLPRENCSSGVWICPGPSPNTRKPMSWTPPPLPR